MRGACLWKWCAARGLPERTQLAATVSRCHLERTPMATDMDMKTAIRKGDADAVRVLFAEDVPRANALIRWGKTGASTRIRSTLSPTCYSRAPGKGQRAAVD